MEGKIFGNTFRNDAKTLDEQFNEKFIQMNDCDDRFTAMSKESFVCGNDDKPFKYRMYIEAYYYKHTWFYILGMVVCKESLRKDVLDDIMACAGVDYDELNEWDIKDYGFGVDLDTEKVEVNDDMDDEYDMDVIYKIANIEGTYRGLCGFFLDKPINKTGTDGWSIINKCI